MNLFSFSRIVGSLAVCAMGSYCMHVTHSGVGIGWAILGLAIIWASAFNVKIKKRSTDNKRVTDL